jgi:signal transduction histidine kinase
VPGPGAIQCVAVLVTDSRVGEPPARAEEDLRALARQLDAERAHLVAAQTVAKMGSWSTDLRTMAVTWSAETHRIFETDPATFSPTHERFLERVHADDLARVEAAFAASLNSRATSTIEHRITMADGRTKWVAETWQATWGDDGTPLRAIGTTQDITARKEIEARLQTTDTRLRAVLNNAPLAVFAIDDHGVFTSSEGKGLGNVGLTVDQLVGHSASEMYADIEIVQPDGTVIRGEEAIRRVLAGESVTGLTSLGGEYFDNHFFPDRDAAGTVVGMIGVCTVVTAHHKAEVRLANSLAELQAVSTRLNDAREQERAKMARDIHDHLGQTLTALKMDVAEVHRRISAGDIGAGDERLAEMSALIDQSVEDVRRVAAELRPVLLDDLGLVAAIRAHCLDVERRTGIRCMLSTSVTDLTIANDRAIALFRILQEALTNVIRHAEASLVIVHLTSTAGWLRLVVHDNGRGISQEAAPNHSGLGIVGMRDRARLFGGDVAVGGCAGKGTTVMVDLPLDGGTA